MTLIKSISGIRGTIGGEPASNLTPIDIVEFVSAFSMMLNKNYDQPSVVVGRDGRISGPMVHDIAVNTFRMAGINVFDLGYSTTPTVSMEVIQSGASGGLMITASHNDMSYNALKFFNRQGECINADDGNELLRIAESRSFTYADHKELGKYQKVTDAFERHIDQILDLPLVDAELIKAR